MREWPQPDWFDDLPPTTGEWKRNVALADYTTIKVGGPAEVFAEFGGWHDLRTFLRWNAAREKDGKIRVSLTVLGKGSNVVIRDGGIPGMVTSLGKGFDKVDVTTDMVYAEAGAASGTAARAARDAELAGLEFLGGIPGSVGGALRMNAGAYGSETYNDLIKLWLIDADGEEHEEDPGFVSPRYRNTELPEGWFFKAGQWRLKPGDKEVIRQRMREINQSRSTTQPLHMPSSGSWFKNVVVTENNAPLLWKAGLQAEVGGKVNAWRVVEAAGCKGRSHGGAQVSEMHGNFLVNTGGALAADFRELSEEVENIILEKFGIRMEREVKFIGVD